MRATEVRRARLCARYDLSRGAPTESNRYAERNFNRFTHFISSISAVVCKKGSSIRYFLPSGPRGPLSATGTIRRTQRIARNPASFSVTNFAARGVGSSRCETRKAASLETRSNPAADQVVNSLVVPRHNSSRLTRHRGAGAALRLPAIRSRRIGPPRETLVDSLEQNDQLRGRRHRALNLRTRARIWDVANHRLKERSAYQMHLVVPLEHRFIAAKVVAAVQP